MTPAELHAAIMNLPCLDSEGAGFSDAYLYAYRCGHRDARHAAAELVLAALPAAVVGDDAEPITEDWLRSVRSAADAGSTRQAPVRQ